MVIVGETSTVMLLGFLAGLLKKIDPGIEPDFISKFPRKSLSDLSDFKKKMEFL